MTDSRIQVRDVVDKFLLLTYDLPDTEAGNKARTHFLTEARAIGAVSHTESVFMMPWSPAAEALALNLAKTEGGEVICWAQAQPLNKAEEITQRYDNALKPIMKEISGRLDKMGDYMHLKQRGRFLKMMPKTERLLANAEAAVTRRGSEVLTIWLELLKGRFAQMVKR